MFSMQQQYVHWGLKCLGGSDFCLETRVIIKIAPLLLSCLTKYYLNIHTQIQDTLIDFAMHACIIVSCKERSLKVLLSELLSQCGETIFKAALLFSCNCNFIRHFNKKCILLQCLVKRQMHKEIKLMQDIFGHIVFIKALSWPCKMISAIRNYIRWQLYGRQLHT